MISKLSAQLKKDEKWKYSDFKLLQFNIVRYFDSKIKNTKIYIKNSSYYYIVIIDGQYNNEKSKLPKNSIDVFYKNYKKINITDIFYYKRQVIQNLQNNTYILCMNIKNNIHKSIKLIKFASSNTSFFNTCIKLYHNCEIKLFENFKEQMKKNIFINNFTKINLNVKSNFKHFLYKTFKCRINMIYTFNLNCFANAFYENYSMNSQDKSYRFDSEVYLNEEKASSDFYIASIAKKNQIFDFVIDVKHRASYTFSKQYYNQVLNNSSISSFFSNVYIPKLINKIKAKQLNKNLIIDEKSKARSRPILNINSNDVICSHGSTTGNIDLEALNYFTSRGIKSFHAKNLIIIGMIKSIFSKCELKEFEIHSLYTKIYNAI